MNKCKTKNCSLLSTTNMATSYYITCLGVDGLEGIFIYTGIGINITNMMSAALGYQKYSVLYPPNPAVGLHFKAVHNLALLGLRHPGPNTLDPLSAHRNLVISIHEPLKKKHHKHRKKRHRHSSQGT